MSDTLLRRVNIQPGFQKNTTEYASEGRWVDGDKVRFRSGNAEKIGGWVKESMQNNYTSTVGSFTGSPRQINTWTGLDSTKYLVSGTESHVEILSGGKFYDVTPYRATVSLVNAIATTNGSPTVTITSAAHNLSVGDYIYVISQATPVATITLSGQYIVVSVPTANTFTITHTSNANATVAAGGGALSIGFYIPSGGTINSGITGYGGGTYGSPGASGGGYDMPRSSTTGYILRQWSFDNWGEDLIACYRNGGVYQWDATSGLSTRLQILSGAPTENLFAMVAQPSRHLVVFGTQQSVGGIFDPLNIRWADQETLTTWTILPTNTAGEYRLPLGNYIVGAIQTRSEILIFTDSTLYSMRYVGGSDVFTFQILASNISAISQNCGVDVNGNVYWMGKDGFYFYNGTVNRLPCDIAQFIFDQDGEGRLNADQLDKVYCATNKEFNEVIWFYPTYDSLENNRYVIYNYLEDIFYDGTMERTTWHDGGVFSKPYATDASGRLYSHEVGKDDDASIMTSYIKSGYFDIEDGQELMFVDKFIPDFKLIPNRNAELTLYFKKYPSGSIITKGPYTFNNNTSKVSIRGRGRQVAFKYSVSVTGADFQVGTARFGIQADGER